MEPQTPVDAVKAQIVTIATHEVLSVWWPRTVIGAVVVLTLTWTTLGFLTALGWTVSYAAFMLAFLTRKVALKAEQIFETTETSIVQLLSCTIVARSEKIIGRLGDDVAHEWIDAESGGVTRRFVFHDFGEPGEDMPENQVWLFGDGVTYVPQPAQEGSTMTEADVQSPSVNKLD